MGASVAWGPFTWVNQGLWLGYFATVAATAAVISWDVVVGPIHAARVAAAVSADMSAHLYGWHAIKSTQTAG